MIPAVLVWKDGRREPAKCGGGSNSIHFPHRGPKGEFLETVFELEPSTHTTGQPWEYRETKTTDITQRMAQAALDVRANTNQTISLGLRVRTAQGWRRRLIEWLLPPL